MIFPIQIALHEKDQFTSTATAWPAFLKPVSDGGLEDERYESRFQIQWYRHQRVA